MDNGTIEVASSLGAVGAGALAGTLGWMLGGMGGAVIGGLAGAAAGGLLGRLIGRRIGRSPRVRSASLGEVLGVGTQKKSEGNAN